eukprot:m.69050 g.69050  ORF g.69050 m.69050 type:complete len:459 (+) comp8263_c0_seq2:44-1420(+)
MIKSIQWLIGNVIGGVAPPLSSPSTATHSLPNDDDDDGADVFDENGLSVVEKRLTGSQHRVPFSRKLGSRSSSQSSIVYRASTSSLPSLLSSDSLIRKPVIWNPYLLEGKTSLEFVYGIVGYIGCVGMAPIVTLMHHIIAIPIAILPLPWIRTIIASECSFFYRQVLLMLRDWGRTKFTLYGDLPQEESQLIIGNHQSFVDWLALVALLRPCGLDGRINFVLKNSLKFIPFYGWFWWLGGFIYIRKSWRDDKQSLVNRFMELKDYTHKYVIAIYPEGTRYTMNKLKQSQQFAISRDLPIFQHVLTPKTKGFVTCVMSLDDSLSAVYDVTLAYTTRSGFTKRPPPPYMQDIVTNRYDNIHIHCKRFERSELPNDEVELAAWLRQRFVEKEEMLERFYAGEGFEGDPIELKESWPSWAFSVIAAIGLFWFVYFTKLGRRMMVWEMLIGGVVCTALASILL